MITDFAVFFNSNNVKFGFFSFMRYFLFASSVLICLRFILPDIVFGSSDTYSIIRGYL